MSLLPHAMVGYLLPVEIELLEGIVSPPRLLSSSWRAVG